MKLNLKAHIGICFVILALLLSACGSVAPKPAEAALSGQGYVVTVKIGAGDSREAVARQYGGRVLTWMPELGLAHLGLDARAHAALSGRGVSVQSTVNGGLKAPEAGVSGFNSWAGGFNSWAGGWNSWAGGWGVWAGGNTATPSPPAENDAVWRQIRLYEANQLAANFGRGIKVAVVDTGIDLSHPMFAGRLAPSAEWRDFLDNDNNPQEVGSSSDRGFGHGTAVAGVVAQVAPRATILPIRVLNKDGMGSLDAVIAAIYHAVDAGAQVVNVSLGSYEHYPPLLDVVRYAASKRVVVVASSGNEGSTGAATYPAEMAWWGGEIERFLYNIGSANTSSAVSSFSNRGLSVMIFAPGEGIATAYPGNALVRASGTSFAAPVVSGLLALALGENRSVNPVNVFTYMMNGTDFPGGFIGLNYGIVNALSTLRGVRGLSGVNYLATPGLNTLTFWTWQVNARRFDPSYSAGGTQVAGAGGAGQVVTDLRPNTTYTFGGWVRVDNPGLPLSLGVRNSGGTPVQVSSSSTTWQWLTFDFTTGPTSTSAEVYFRKDGAAGSAFFDEFGLWRK